MGADRQRRPWVKTAETVRGIFCVFFFLPRVYRICKTLELFFFECIFSFSSFCTVSAGITRRVLYARLHEGEEALAPLQSFPNGNMLKSTHQFPSTGVKGCLPSSKTGEGRC